MLHARRKAEIEVLASATAPRRNDLMSMAMGDTSSSMASMNTVPSSQSTSSASGGDSTPPTSQDVDTPTECALVRYLVAKIGDYVERAKARDAAD
jgi:hypothetical protein